MGVFDFLIGIIKPNYKWPVNVLIRMPRSGGQEFFFDKARRITEEKTKKQVYRLRKTKVNVKPASFKNMIRTNKGLFVEVYSPTPDEFYPCKMADGGSVVVMNEDQKMFYADELDKLYHRWDKKTWWDKYGATVMYVTMPAITALAIVLIFYGYNEYGIDALKQAQHYWRQVAELGKGALTAAQGGSIIPLPPA